MNDRRLEPALDLLTQAIAFFDEKRYAEALTLAQIVRSDPATEPTRKTAAGQLVERVLSRCTSIPREHSPAPEAYHRWYYDNLVWMTTTYLGISILKLPSDMWNYQEILSELRPRMVVEFGTYSGASALFFAHTLRLAGLDGKVLTVDIDSTELAAPVLAEPTIERMCCSSIDPAVAERIAELRTERPGPIFVILDSDHRKEHVLAEMLMLRTLLVCGDYLVVEDANINGHPVRPTHGPGPFEAMAEYFARYPNDYEHDLAREHKFGLTFATNGFLRRR